MSRTFQALRLFLRRTSWAPAPEWNESDARALATFLGGTAGRKLQALLAGEIAVANERAAMSRGSAYECGWACGYRGLFAWFQALSAQAPTAGAITTEPSPGAAEDLAHLAP